MKPIYSIRGVSLLLLLFATITYAAPSVNSDTHSAVSNETTLLTLSGSAEGYINNSQVHISLSQESRNADLTTLVNQLNQKLNNALTLAKKYPDVTLTTGSVSYLPIYPQAIKTTSDTATNQSTPLTWQGAASLNIQSNNFQQVSQLLNELQQQQILIENVSYTATSLEKQQLEQQLIPEAVQDLTKKSEAIAKAMGKHLINIQKISLSQYNDTPTPFLISAYAAPKASSENSNQTLPLAPGKTKLSVTLSATVALQ